MADEYIVRKVLLAVVGPARTRDGKEYTKAVADDATEYSVWKATAKEQVKALKGKECWAYVKNPNSTFPQIVGAWDHEPTEDEKSQSVQSGGGGFRSGKQFGRSPGERREIVAQNVLSHATAIYTAYIEAGVIKPDKDIEARELMRAARVLVMETADVLFQYVLTKGTESEKADPTGDDPGAKAAEDVFDAPPF